MALFAGLIAAPAFAPAFAQAPPAGKEADDTVFVLGRIENISGSDGQVINEATIDADAMREFDRASVDEAIDLLPGANSSNTGGSRNERLIFVRGFDRFQTTLTIDGVRVFLPADNRIDFGRFLSADLAEVQVSKGYVSVLNGPGGIGGAVNLVTRKPTQALEAELVTTVTADKGLEANGESASGLLGTANDTFYAQVSGAWQNRDSWSLSDDFRPTQPTLEDGGERSNSASEDWRVNVKAGWTPNATDEYAISYIKSSGEKNAPYHTSDTASTRFWTWPYWDIESVYFLSRTQLGGNWQMRSRVYYNTFQNLLSSFDNAAQNTQTLPRAFDSYYDDTAYGGNLTFENKYAEGESLTAAFHYRKDEHNEQQDGFIRTPATGNPSANAPYSEPWQGTEEETFSIALENVRKLTGQLDLVVGASYEWTNLTKASDVNVSVTGTTIANSVIVFTPVNYPLKDMDAVNAQAALIWHTGPNASIHATASSRTRFPTLFERFSSRFGTAIPNPDIEPERALNLELGGEWQMGGTNVQAAAFYTDFDDALIQVPVNLGAPFGVVNQTRNVGDADYWGGEISITTALSDTITAGGNLTLIHREFEIPPQYLDANNFNLELQGVPESRLFLFADWEAMPKLRITPSLEVAGSRYTATSSSLISPIQYYETGAYSLVNLSVNYDLTDNVSILFSGKNLTDENYVLVDGFPEEGANYALSLKFRN
jgi:iron complex outermembrane receptor protein